MIGAGGRLEYGVVAVALRHHQGGAPDVGFGDHPKKICKGREHFASSRVGFSRSGQAGVSSMESLLYFVSMSAVAAIIFFGALNLW